MEAPQHLKGPWGVFRQLDRNAGQGWGTNRHKDTVWMFLSSPAKFLTWTQSDYFLCFSLFQKLSKDYKVLSWWCNITQCEKSEGPWKHSSCVVYETLENHQQKSFFFERTVLSINQFDLFTKLLLVFSPITVLLRFVLMTCLIKTARVVGYQIK